MRILTIALLAISFCAVGQEVKIEFDKKHDFSKYKTFSFGESKVVTSSEQKTVSDATVDKWIRNGVARELQFKGLKKVDSAGADLVVSYAIVSIPRLDVQPIGPAGGTPGSNDRTWSRNYTETNLIVDLNNRSNFLVWRVSGLADVVGRDAERSIDQIIERGFKKYGRGIKRK